MVPLLQFEARYRAQWQELEALLAQVRARRPLRGSGTGPRLLALYTQCCEHLALARTRGYPTWLVVELERLATEAHQLIYRRSDWGLAGLRALLLQRLPAQVRAMPAQLALAGAAFVLPALALAWLVYRDPRLIGTLFDAQGVGDLERMYAPDAASIGQPRSAATDWGMFGYYIRHNIGIAFQCFAGGVFAGLGSLFYLAFNGALLGAVAGYLGARGMGVTFWPFVATHSAFELTAIVLAGTAGLRLGAAVLVPGRRTRGEALGIAGRESSVVLAGVVLMLLLAAAIEAFWSSAQWLPAGVKFASAALCWSLVCGFFLRLGRGGGGDAR